MGEEPGPEGSEHPESGDEDALVGSAIESDAEEEEEADTEQEGTPAPGADKQAEPLPRRMAMFKARQLALQVRVEGVRECANSHIKCSPCCCTLVDDHACALLLPGQAAFLHLLRLQDVLMGVDMMREWELQRPGAVGQVLGLLEGANSEKACQLRTAWEVMLAWQAAEQEQQPPRSQQAGTSSGQLNAQGQPAAAAAAIAAGASAPSSSQLPAMPAPASSTGRRNLSVSAVVARQASKQQPSSQATCPQPAQALEELPAALEAVGPQPGSSAPSEPFGSAQDAEDDGCAALIAQQGAPSASPSGRGMRTRSAATKGTDGARVISGEAGHGLAGGGDAG